MVRIQTWWIFVIHGLVKGALEKCRAISHRSIAADGFGSGFVVFVSGTIARTILIANCIAINYFKLTTRQAYPTIGRPKLEVCQTGIPESGTASSYE